MTQTATADTEPAPRMIILTFTLFGALLGALNARRRGGTPADLAQYAAATGIALGLVGLLVSIAIARI